MRELNIKTKDCTFHVL